MIALAAAVLKLAKELRLVGATLIALVKELKRLNDGPPPPHATSLKWHVSTPHEENPNA